MIPIIQTDGHDFRRFDRRQEDDPAERDGFSAEGKILEYRAFDGH
jgi:hypothetical protein